MKKLLSMILVLTLVFSLASCQPPNEDPKNPGDDGSVAGTSVALVTVSINPSIELSLDENGLVAGVYGANEDGQILLYGETDNILNKSYEDAIAYVTNLSVRLGYLDAETGTVNTSVIAEDAAFAAEVQSKLGDKIKAAATANGITVSIDTSDPFSLISELEELKAKYPSRADIQALTPSDYRLASTLSEREGISILEAVGCDKEDMLKRIGAAHNTLETHATEAYLAAKREATRIFEKSMGIVVAGAYNEVYLKNIMAHTGTFYYGAAYQAYAVTALTYRSVYEIKAFGDAMTSYELDEATINAVKEELGLTDTTALENEEGKITIDSLIAFCDDFLAKNSVDDEVETELRRIIAGAKAAAELADKATTTMYSADMAALKTQIGIVVGSINTAYTTAKLLMTDEQKAAVEAVLADLALVEAKVGEIMEGGVTLSEVDALATEAEEKAAEILEDIKADLSEAELNEAEEKIKALKALQTQLTTDFQNRLTEAENTAKSYIEQARAEREAANSDN